ncbi:Sad1p [Sugiyamaella lignohabitans]|uniref:Sad1p n=1 Tax=Sugiyamaella lignohabitans TaxID=796027 RepID=A0A167ECY1_9ASCO|nr:Sad1p [Sugiyamaella lignohabitans]ANB13919.1 Sad1p [Sugiyamaella lignohabitans]
MGNGDETRAADEAALVDTEISAVESVEQNGSEIQLEHEHEHQHEHEHEHEINNSFEKAGSVKEIENGDTTEMRTRKRRLNEEKNDDDENETIHTNGSVPGTSTPDSSEARGAVGSGAKPQPPEVRRHPSNSQSKIEEEQKEEEEEEEGVWPVRPVRQVQEPSSSMLYLDTVDRSRLDFDFEKICSVSLSVVNVYACLCCGKYFQGRGKSSYAFVHSVDVDHHVFINLQTLKIYVLPEGYEVKTTALDDIKYVIDPWYTADEIKSLDTVALNSSFDLTHKQYYPGYIGINNIKANDYANVVIQILSHVSPVRDFFLTLGQGRATGSSQSNGSSASISMANSMANSTNGTSQAGSSELASRLSTLIRKIWNPRAFRAHVSPHELLQSVSSASKKQFTSTQQSDPFLFFTWLLNRLTAELTVGPTNTRFSRDSSPGTPTAAITTAVSTTTTKDQQPVKKKLKPTSTRSSKPIKPRGIIQKTFQGTLLVEQQQLPRTLPSGASADTFLPNEPIKTTETPFLCLTLDLPPIPLFKESTQDGAPVIPQVTLKSLLNKYNGTTVTTDEITKTMKKYKLTRVPEFLVLRIKRITRNLLGDADERNPTVVSFSPTNLDMAPYLTSSSTTSPSSTRYNLIANVVCEWDGNTPRWKIQLLDKSRDRWLQIENLLVEPIQRELLFLSESHLQIWQRQSPL